MGTVLHHRDGMGFYCQETQQNEAALCVWAQPQTSSWEYWVLPNCASRDKSKCVQSGLLIYRTLMATNFTALTLPRKSGSLSWSKNSQVLNNPNVQHRVHRNPLSDHIASHFESARFQNIFIKSIFSCFLGTRQILWFKKFMGILIPVFRRPCHVKSKEAKMPRLYEPFKRFGCIISRTV